MSINPLKNHTELKALEAKFNELHQKIIENTELSKMDVIDLSSLPPQIAELYRELSASWAQAEQYLKEEEDSQLHERIKGLLKKLEETANIKNHKPKT